MGLEQLATSLVHNKTLVWLLLCYGDSDDIEQEWPLISGTPNHFTDQVVPVLSNCLRHNLTLTKLEIRLDSSNSSSYDIIEEAINAKREKLGLPHIKLDHKKQKSDSCNIL